MLFLLNLLLILLLTLPLLLYLLLRENLPFDVDNRDRFIDVDVVVDDKGIVDDVIPAFFMTLLLLLLLLMNFDEFTFTLPPGRV